MQKMQNKAQERDRGMHLGLTFTIIATGLIVIGVAYGYKVYKWPFKRTWIDVVIGCGYTLTGGLLAQAAALHYYGLLEELGWILILPLAAFAITGLAMVGFQEFKRLEQHWKSENALLKYRVED